MERRDSLMGEIGNVLLNSAGQVFNGYVVFLSSYAFAEKLWMHWGGDRVSLGAAAAGGCGVEAFAPGSPLARLAAVKRIFAETRGADLDALLPPYRVAAATMRGALLFAIVGGKLSEGFNFSDELARAVAVVGMPYPYKGDPELDARMKYLERQERGAGEQFYRAQCMTAVNQSIGRAVRHRGDYAAILLLDERYAEKETLELLPGWIRERILDCRDWGCAARALGEFFHSWRPKATAAAAAAATAVAAGVGGGGGGGSSASTR
jgi:chromosome transmission fidelity protein 1